MTKTCDPGRLCRNYPPNPSSPLLSSLTADWYNRHSDEEIGAKIFYWDRVKDISVEMEILINEFVLKHIKGPETEMRRMCLPPSAWPSAASTISSILLKCGAHLPDRLPLWGILETPERWRPFQPSTETVVFVIQRSDYTWGRQNFLIVLFGKSWGNLSVLKPPLLWQSNLDYV